MEYKKSLNALRGIAMIGIFAFHNDILPGGGYLVTFFIVLSGFFSIYSYKKKSLNTKIIPIQYGIDRIAKFYPVHLICFFAAVFLLYCEKRLVISKKLLFEIIINNSLLQALIPNHEYYFSFNAVEWTLSLLFICYILTPWINRILPYLFKKNIGFIVLYLAELLYIGYFGNKDNYIWFCGINPFFRVIDYIIGCGLAYRLISGSENKQYRKKTKFEIISLLSMCLGVFVITPQLSAAWLWSGVFTPLSLFLIWSFCSDNGIISKKIFNRRIFQILGAISFEFYMIHQLIIRFLKLFTENHLILIIGSFFFSIIGAMVLNKYIKMRKKIMRFVNKKNISEYFKILLPSCLMCIYPVIFLFCNNIEEINGTDIFYPTILFIGFGLLITVCCSIIYRDIQKSGVISFFLCIFCINYTFLEKVIIKIFPMAKWWHIVPVVVISICLLASFAYNYFAKNKGKTFYMISTLVSIVLIFMNIIIAIPVFINEIQNNPTNERQLVHRVETDSTLPNVYYFIFDEYSNFDVLEKYFNYDNAAFAKFLEDNNFTVSYNSINESSETATVTTNYISLDYVVNDSDSAQLRKEIRENGYLFELMEAHGYQIWSHGSSDEWFGLGGSVGASTISGDNATTILLKNTIFYPFLRDSTYLRGTEFLEKMHVFRNPKMYSSQNLNFRFAYHIFPHQPFIFDANGGDVALKYTNEWHDPQYYLNQLIFITKEIEDAITNIIKYDPNAIIILQSDHSARGLLNDKGEAIIEMNDRRQCLNAVYYGGKPLDSIRGASGLNTLRIVFSQLLNENFPVIQLIEDGEMSK